ncbi:hypothetical protein ETD86_08760 [Nonomuraea turkmeniaca]|uniref:DUF3558 domain-containing protein n=1 Tax=Nonomuraea turkmeniaca TaxID=103838 RepID=A0A5S4GB05_9ACTN|nr:hypothetical protein [Nonomuraea turkmeniaca]TMR23190.1 hypothetical protein ETD86_08760 [Nonomuraea turkmeniaca]
MRRLAAVLLVLLVLSLTGCGGGDTVPDPEPTGITAPPSPNPARSKTFSLSCGGAEVRLPAMPAKLKRAGSFGHLASLVRRLDVEGLIWRRNDEHLYVGVVCGVRTAEQFATLVARSTLTVYKGRPALRWTTKKGLRNFMWLERPGTAVYIGATPGLAPQIKQIAGGVSASLGQ